MGRYIGTKFGTAYKYIFAIQGNDLDILPTKYGIGTEMLDYQMDDFTYEYAVEIYPDSIYDMEELVKKLSNNMTQEQILQYAKPKIMEYINKQTDNWKKGFADVIKEIEKAKTSWDFPISDSNVYIDKKLESFPLELVYQQTVNVILKEDIHFIDMCIAMIKHMKENLENLRSDETFIFTEW
jgi:hypothetical protein